MPTRGPNLAERNSGGIETTAKHNRKETGTEADYTTSEAQADRSRWKLGTLWERLEVLKGLKDQIVRRFEQALERLRNSTNQKIRNELNTNSQAETEDNTSQAELEDDISKKYGQIATIKISRRRALKLLCGLVTTAAVAPFLPDGLGNIPTASAAEAGTSRNKP